MDNDNMTENEKYVYEGKQFCGADSLYSPVAEVAKLFPRNTALRFFGKNISYAKLIGNIEEYAGALIKAGVKKGDTVAFALPNIPECVYLLYAAAKIGAAAMPLHPLSAPDAICSAMQRAGCGIIFVLPEAVEKTADACRFAAVVAVSPVRSLIIKRALYNLRRRCKTTRENSYSLNEFLRGAVAVITPKSATIRSAAVLLQSGGTGGSPKLIALGADSINGLAKKGMRALERGKVTDCGMLCVLPISHGFGLSMGVHAMLCHGGKNVLFPKFRRADTVKEIARKNIQFLIGIPRLYEALLSHKKFRGKKLRSLYIGFVGGDFVPQTLLENFDSAIKAAGGNCRLFEGYGLTETVNVCAVNTYSHNRLRSVGKPLYGLEIAAFDVSQNGPELLPHGKHGELAVCGDTLMLEYLSDPDGTGNAFFEYKGKKYVRTGDCGYTDDDGYVYFVSRIKRIIKVKGISVYPSQIEHVVNALPKIKEACVVGVPGKSDEESVTLFAVPDGEPDYETIRAAVRDKISDYAVPQSIVFLPELPRTNIGKIDTQALVREYKNSKI